MPEKDEYYYDITVRIYPESEHFRLTDRAWQEHLLYTLQDGIGKAGAVRIIKICKHKLLPEKNEHYYDITVRIYPESEHFRLTDRAWQEHLLYTLQDGIGNAGVVRIIKICKHKLPKETNPRRFTVIAPNR